MQIVIDIPKEMYQTIKETSNVISGRRSGKRIDYTLFNAVYNGTPLPKGHGKIIDESAITEVYTYETESEEVNGIQIYPKIEIVGTNAPTIIEADDKEGNNEDSN